MFWRRKGRAEAPPADRETIFKVCVLGDAACGKSELLRPLVYSMMPDAYITTIGTKVTKRTLDYKRAAGALTARVRATLLPWDILGQKQYSKLHPVYYQGAVGAIVVAREVAADPFGSMQAWALSLKDVVGPIPLAFLLNGTSPADGPLPPRAADLLARFPGSTVARVSADDPTATAHAIRLLGERLVDGYLSRHPLPHAGAPVEPSVA